ncbi:hypothetical protein AJ78_08572, partial [Emergomyces pasteurianus Ep9510]
MAQTRRLLKREITYSAAAEEPFDILHALNDYPQTILFFAYLRETLALIQQLAACTTLEFPQTHATFALKSYHTVSVKPFGREMPTRKYDVRQEHMHSCRETVVLYPFPSYMALRSLLVK